MGRSLLFWSLMGSLALGLGVLVVQHDRGSVAGLSLEDFSALVVLTALLVFLGGGMVTVFRHQLGTALTAVALWLALGLVLAAGYTYRQELRQVADRILAEVMPGRPAAHGKTVEIARGQRGEFLVVAQINGAGITTIFDTGASAVVLTQEAAKAAGLPLELLNYSVAVETANGRTRAAPVTLDRLAIGGIVERSVPALIAQPGQLRVSLLGMSFLNRLQSWGVTGDRLTMRAYP